MNSVIAKAWSELTTEEVYEIARLRSNVFLVEQHVDDEELDRRDLEPDAMHWFVADDQGIASYLRTLLNAEAEYADAHRIVGRVVTRADRRGEGLAMRLFGAVLERFGTEPLLLHAQSYIAPLYRKSGFVEYGQEYIEAGIPHISMYRSASAVATASEPTLPL
ncbi:GNAT family N-acetyltransferase [Microbacteriaceae bacterium VKM Ac-2854]|nr:GNAT family N-acetyltransferase [Microbacteriaceae bacterium VKM Ac-2854]